MSEVLHHFQSASRKEPIGVCLWGPLGCGKSSAIAQIEAVTGTNSDDLMIINSDDWTVFLAKTSGICSLCVGVSLPPGGSS